MEAGSLPRDRFLRLARLTAADSRRIRRSRRAYNPLGFAYQIAFVRLATPFSSPKRFAFPEELVTFVAVQTDKPPRAFLG